ncbi:DEAD/DEAH box helicase family protein, partial [Patescibacteria group bacterium]
SYDSKKLSQVREFIQSLDFRDFSIEMETGTGKTYVYLRTIFELNRKYGLKKFIILVPSVAIREGVLKTLEQTRDHFLDLFEGVGFGYFSYDSKKLSQVREFIQSLDVQIMIMTIQSFNKDANIMRQTPDRFNGESPLDLIARTNPVVIMDEPQNMESELSKSAILDLNALFRLRYSATHKNKHNLMYILSPADAYKRGLVKKIEVFGVKENESNEFVFDVSEIKAKKDGIRAMVRLEANQKNEFVNKEFLLRSGDDLIRKTKNEKYRDIFVNEINAKDGFVELSDGEIFRAEEKNEENKEEIFRTQIRETIKAHFEKQNDLGKNIKVLSLFFIDKVANYIEDNGLIRKIFVEEFEKLKSRSEFFRDTDVESVHNGYFACSKKKGEMLYKDTTGKTLADKEVYDLIMKDKERLLSFSEKTCFVFSHSALKEGWDNPNIFQICTLKETKSASKKRQEIGRGVRLAVNSDGDRIFDRNVNILTVIANESYKDFVGSLQDEYFEAGYKESPDASDARKRVDVKFRYDKMALPDDFLELWNRINKRTRFSMNFDNKELIEKCIQNIDNNLNVDNLAIRVERVDIDFDGDGKLKTRYQGDLLGEKMNKKISLDNFIKRIANQSDITKKTVFEILERVDNFDLIFNNPEEYVRGIILIIKNSLNEMLINNGLKYFPVNDIWEIEIFEDLKGYENKVLESEKSVYEKVVFDSEGEREFAESLEESSKVKLFSKLPPKFVIDTPLGEYNPDWAIVMTSVEGEKLYLVRETKFGIEMKNLRPSEQQKILCGQKHFSAIGVDFKVSKEKDLRDLL